MKKSMRSSLEELVSHLLTHASIPFTYESTSIKYTSPATSRRYTPDFVLSSGKTYIETKGRFTASDRKKMLLVKEQHPTLTFIMLFGKADNKLSKFSGTTYGDWCTKHGILWADLKEFKENPKTCLLRLLRSKGGTSNPPAKKN